MSIIELRQFLLESTNARFEVSQKLDQAVLSVFDRENTLLIESNQDFLVQRTGPYLNIDLSTESFDRLLQNEWSPPKIHKQPGVFWIEYFSPNIAKQLHIGHVRNVNTGIALQNLLRITQEKVVFDSHLGDWGIQFGVLLWSILLLDSKQQDYFYVTIMDETVEITTDLKNTDPAAYYTYLYVWGNQQKESHPQFDTEVRELFLRLSQGDEKLVNLWKAIVESCKTANEAEVKLLNMPTPDFVLGESSYETELKNLLSFVVKHKLLIEDGQALYLNFSGIAPDSLPSNLRKSLETLAPKVNQELGRGYWVSSTGYSTYLSRDIAARIQWAREYNIAHALTITDSSQNHHMKQVIVACSWLAGLPSFVEIYGEHVAHVLRGDIEHIGYGRVVLKSGKMSTRKGNFVTAQDVIESTLQEARSILQEKNPGLDPDVLEQNAEAITSAAIKWNDLKSAIHQDSVFDLGSILSFEGNTGVYQLYTYARLNSILKKFAFEDSTGEINSLLLTQQEKILLRMIYCTHSIILEAAEYREPHRLVNWLSKLAQLTNTWYANTSVLKETDQTRQLALVCLIKRLMETQRYSLDILGIRTVNTL